MDMEKDPLFRGEFEVVKELLGKYPAFEVAKNQTDKLIDLNGPKSSGGTGIKQLRENIAGKDSLSNRNPKRMPFRLKEVKNQVQEAYCQFKYSILLLVKMYDPDFRVQIEL